MHKSGETPRTVRARWGELTLQLVTDPRMRPWAEVEASELLLARYAAIEKGDRVLVWPAGHGGLVILAARRSDPERVMACDVHWVAARVCEENLARYGLPGVRVRCDPPQVDDGPFDVILLSLPKGRATQRLYVALAHELLRPGGRLYVAGANAAGAKSAFRELETLFQPLGVLGYKGGHRAAVFERNADQGLEGAFAEPGIAPGTWRAFEWEVAGRQHRAKTTAGVFSWEHLDPGTALLLEAVSIPADVRVLDLGCGWGAIGVHAAGQAHAGNVTLVDVNALAVRSAGETLHANGIENARVVLGDGAKAAGPGPYDLVLSNPPFHRGHG
ncbi:MAG: methyltransferase, partial [Anaerolineae bacterium]